MSEVEKYKDALRKLRDNWPAEADEPEPEDYDDMESAYNNGVDVATYEAHVVAKAALDNIEAPAEGAAWECGCKYEPCPCEDTRKCTTFGATFVMCAFHEGAARLVRDIVGGGYTDGESFDHGEVIAAAERIHAYQTTPPEPAKTETWKCRTCGSENVEGRSFTMLNTGAATLDEGDDESYCQDCGGDWRRWGVCRIDEAGNCSLHTGRPCLGINIGGTGWRCTGQTESDTACLWVGDEAGALDHFEATDHDCEPGVRP